MKRQALVKKIKEAAKEADREWSLVRQGANHEFWRCGNTKVAIPRHREIAEGTAEDIQKQLNPELGEDWWK